MVVLLLGVIITANAQQKKELAPMNQKDCPGNIDSMQCERMANLLMLNNATTEKFKPAYIHYLSDLTELRKIEKERCESNKPCKEKTLTDTEVEGMIEQSFEISQKLLDIKIKYYKTFKEILSAKQIARIYQNTCQPNFRPNRDIDYNMPDKCTYTDMPPIPQPDCPCIKHFPDSNGEDDLP